MASGGQDDKSLAAKKAFEALGGAELIAAAVETLNPPAPGAQDWVLSDFSPDGVADTLLFEVSKSLGLQTGNSDLEQTLITTVIYAVRKHRGWLLQYDGQYFLLPAIAIAQIKIKLDNLIQDVGALLHEPLESARKLVEEALMHFKMGDLDQGLKIMEEVNKNATKALSLLESRGNEENKLEDLLKTTQLRILAQIAPKTVVTTAKGKVLAPPIKLPRDQRMKISTVVTNHLNNLVRSVDRTKPGPVKKLFTRKRKEKKEERQAKIDKLMKTTVPLLVPTITKTDEGTRKIQLPSTKFFPDGVEDRTFLIIDKPDGSKEKLWVWTELKNNKLVLFYRDMGYKTDLQDNHSISVKEGRIVGMTVDADTCFIDTDGHSWSCSELSLVADLVTAGLITTIKYLLLGYPHKYSLADLENVTSIARTVTEKVWIDLSCIPVINSEICSQLYNIWGKVRQLRLWSGVVGGGAEAGVGRLVSRVSSATLGHVEIRHFLTFVNNLVVGQGEEGARCEEIRFGGSTASDNRDQIATLGNTLGWTVKEGSNDDIIISR